MISVGDLDRTPRTMVVTYLPRVAVRGDLRRRLGLRFHSMTFPVNCGVAVRGDLRRRLGLDFCPAARGAASVWQSEVISVGDLDNFTTYWPAARLVKWQSEVISVGDLDLGVLTRAVG